MIFVFPPSCRFSFPALRSSLRMKIRRNRCIRRKSRRSPSSIIQRLLLRVFFSGSPKLAGRVYIQSRSIIYAKNNPVYEWASECEWEGAVAGTLYSSVCVCVWNSFTWVFMYVSATNVPFSPFTLVQEYYHQIALKHKIWLWAFKT